MASVTLSSVSVRYPSGAQGLGDVDLQVEDGEFLALVGPSGSGKTTLLRSVAGFLAPTSGRILIGDREVAGSSTFVAPEHRGLGMVFQQHAVWPHWNVGRNVEYPLKRLRVPRAERSRRVAEVLELVGLDGYSKRDPASLSGGQRQRVALARALVGRPRVLLLDEALSALDEPLRDRLRLELRTLTRDLGLTVLHVTHDRSEALALADRVVVLDAGRVQQVDAPRALVAHPASAFVAEFLSDATIVHGAVDVDGFAGTDHPLRLAPESLRSSVRGEVTVAVLPSEVRVTPREDGDAIVRSALFTRDGSDLVIEWHGLALRSRTLGIRPAVGDRVSVQIHNALCYPRDGVPVVAEPAGSGMSA